MQAKNHKKAKQKRMEEKEVKKKYKRTWNKGRKERKKRKTKKQREEREEREREVGKNWCLAVRVTSNMPSKSYLAGKSKVESVEVFRREEFLEFC